MAPGLTWSQDDLVPLEESVGAALEDLALDNFQTWTEQTKAIQVKHLHPDSRVGRRESFTWISCV